MRTNAANFYSLTPGEVLDGVQNTGLLPTGTYFQLNSYENRVFDIFLEPGSSPELNDRVIAKYYRPERWSKEALFEEHEFLLELNNNDIPAIAPLIQNNNSTLSLQGGIYLALFPKGLGRLPQELNRAQRLQIGKMLAQVHNVGRQHPAKHRPSFTVDAYGWDSLERLQNWVAPEVWGRYQKASEQILFFLEDHLNPDEYIRIHGDCHLGNLLLYDKRDEPQKFFLVDFDDFCMGPPAQDFWMLLPDTVDNAKEELYDLIEGYETFSQFQMPNLKLFEALRGLRVLYYAGWIAKRFSDPTFPNLFPQFQEYIYWAEETETLERIAWSL